MSKKALIFGINGQDGSYLAELLIEKGYEVHGAVRRASQEPKNLENIAHILPQIKLHSADLLDQSSLNAAVSGANPDEVYNLAAQSHVAVSFKQPEATANITGLGLLRILEAVRSYNCKTKVYQASSSEMFGDVAEEPQTEQTELRARSPYGAAKIFAHHIAKVYRESYGMFVSCGILFNHESSRRGLNFVTRKITDHVARQALGLTKAPLELGNLDARRDWGHASDYVLAMWLMLQQDKPDDYVIASGETHTVREFVEATYSALEIPVPIEWHGRGTNEVGLVGMGLGNGATLEHLNKLLETFGSPKFYQGCRVDPVVVVDEKFYRPADVNTLTGDYSKAKRVLGWEPKISFKGLVEMMVESDLNLLKAK